MTKVNAKAVAVALPRLSFTKMISSPALPEEYSDATSFQSATVSTRNGSSIVAHIRALGYGECYVRVNRKYENLTRDEARLVLRQFQEKRADWRNQAGDCMKKREEATASFETAGASGPFASLSDSVKTQTWSIVYLDMETAVAMCESIRDFAHSFDFNG